MSLPAEKPAAVPVPDTDELSTLEALRTRIAERFRGTVPEGAPPPCGPALESGWPAVDRELALRPGDAVVLHAPPGAGGLALASAWARAASRQNEPVLVIDAEGSCLPHPWVAPPDGRAPLWVIVPPRPDDAWPAVDIGLRAGAFGLLVLLDPPSPPPRTGPRLAHLARTRRSRLLVHARTFSLPGTASVSLRAAAVQWRDAPVGSAPAARALEVSARPSQDPQPFLKVVRHDDVHTDRLRPSPRAADRRPSHGRTRDRYET